MVLGKDIICNDIFNCTYVTIKNFHMDGLWENMNNLWVYDPIILISMITLNHGRNTVSKGKTNYFFLFSWNAHCMFILLYWHLLFYVIYVKKCRIWVLFVYLFVIEDYWRYKQKTKYTNLSAFCFDFFMTHPCMKYTNKSLLKYWKKSFEQINEWVETLNNWFGNKLRHVKVRLGQQNIFYVWLFQ